jgi:dTDP-4-dehydrorhamnose reductase
MNYLIIGASGLVGGNLYNYLKEINEDEVIGTYNTFKEKNFYQLDTVQPVEIWNKKILNFNPDVVVFCGGLIHVEKCEEDEKSSYERNILSFKNALSYSKTRQSKFVYLSTDYVFDGKNGPYTEYSDKNPLSIYGTHKSDAEDILMKSELNHLILRITNVYGKEIQNKNFINQLLNNQNRKFKIPDWQYSTPVNAFDVARAIKLLINDDKKGIYHLSSTDFLSRVDLVRLFNEFSNKKIEFEIINESENFQLAKRPKFGGLINYKFKSEYPEFKFSSLASFLINSLK